MTVSVIFLCGLQILKILVWYGYSQVPLRSNLSAVIARRNDEATAGNHDRGTN